MTNNHITGVLKGNTVLIRNKAYGNKLYNNGYLGSFKNNRLRISLIEACYLLENEKIIIKNYGFITFFRYCSTIKKDFDVCYYVYRDLKDRMFKIKVLEDTLYIVKNHTKIAVLCYRSNTLITFKTLYNIIKSYNNIVLGVVDDEFEITYFKLTLEQPHGKFQFKDLLTLTGIMTANAVLVKNIDENLNGLGKKVGNFHAFSVLEAIYLMEKGQLTIEGTDVEKLTVDAKSSDPLFELKYKIYKNLTDHGVLLKSGFKYGALFRAYLKDLNTHAETLIQLFHRKERLETLAQSVRVAHGVKKKLILTNASKYISMEWITPHLSTI